MQLQFSSLVLSLGVLTFVAAYIERYRDLRIVLEYEYKPKYWFSHFQYVNFNGRGPIKDWDSIVITYIDEEYRDLMKKEMESGRADFDATRYLLSREIKEGDALGKGVAELDEYWIKMYGGSEGTTSDPKAFIHKTSVKNRETVVERLRKWVYNAVQPIKNVLLWGIAISRNAGTIYEGSIYTISLNGNAWRVATLPSAYGKDYDPTAALNMTERIGYCIDREWDKLRRENFATIGWRCTTDNHDNWQPDIYFMIEDGFLLVWDF
ncbi:hypothetical protein CLIB1423_18S00804 [[Candida] railenensis]|uniref:Uncharacterized protein n=1 Tax=[Candida] railenensis TaxID=45579 RepID=A0A9P0W060_9ASCO|nr:hypothetical protein CLIB1423_18S00804 [[Candida] railenensis]